MSNSQGQGIFISDDYLLARQNIEDIIIVPFDPKRAKGTGYNLSPCTLIYSVNEKRLVRVHENEKEVYVWVEPHDTILTISREYIITKRSVAGMILSRVRMSANGLGNVSTTLDPGWKGKLLLAISNPTSRRIKLCIEEKKDGKAIPVALVTMTIFRTGRDSETASEASLHLDNPPMRTDIWQDLTEKPAGIKGAQQYEQFQQIIQRVTDFKAEKGTRYCDLQHIISKVIAVREGIKRGDSLPNIRALTVGLEYELDQVDGDDLLKQKFAAWNSLLLKAKSLDDLRCDEQVAAESCLLRECQYLIMCDEIDQHDKFIRQQIEQYWEGNGLARFFKKRLFPNVPILFAIMFIVGILFFGGDYSPVEKVLLSAVTPVVAVFIEWFSRKFSSKPH